MNVLSLFDGCSGGQVALQKLGITFDGILRVRAFSRQGTRASSRRYSKCLRR